MYSKDQLQQVQQSPIASPMAKLYGAGLMQENARMQNNPLAKQVMAQPLPTPMAQAPVDQTPTDPRMGVASIATRPDMTQMAGGGIIAFAEGDSVPAPDTKSVYDKVIAKGLDDYLSGKNTATEAIKEAQIQEAKSIQADKDRQLGLAMLEGGFKGLQNTSPYFGVGLGVLGSGVVGSYAKQQQGISEAEKEMRKEKLEAQKADEARQSEIFGKTMTLKEMEGMKQAQLKSAEATQEANRLIRKQDIDRQAQVAFANAYDTNLKTLMSSPANKIALMDATKYDETMAKITKQAQDMTVAAGWDPGFLKSHNIGQYTKPAAINLTPQQTQAKEWAMANPKDPRSAAILKTLPQNG
jgi:hypothetical protein